MKRRPDHIVHRACRRTGAGAGRDLGAADGGAAGRFAAGRFHLRQGLLPAHAGRQERAEAEGRRIRSRSPTRSTRRSRSSSWRPRSPTSRRSRPNAAAARTAAEARKPKPQPNRSPSQSREADKPDSRSRRSEAGAEDRRQAESRRSLQARPDRRDLEEGRRQEAAEADKKKPTPREAGTRRAEVRRQPGRGAARPARAAAPGGDRRQRSTTRQSRRRDWAAAAQLSQSEIDALRARIARCWNPPAGVDVERPSSMSCCAFCSSRTARMAQEPVVVEGTAVGAWAGAGRERQARAADVPAVHHAQARALRPVERH